MIAHAILSGDLKNKVSPSCESYLKKEFPYPFRPTGDVSGHIGQPGDHQGMSGCRQGWHGFLRVFQEVIRVDLVCLSRCQGITRTFRGYHQRISGCWKEFSGQVQKILVDVKDFTENLRGNPILKCRHVRPPTHCWSCPFIVPWVLGMGCCPGKRNYPQPVGPVPLLCREFLVWVAAQVGETTHSRLVLSLYCAVSSWYGLLPR